MNRKRMLSATVLLVALAHTITLKTEDKADNKYRLEFERLQKFVHNKHHELHQNDPMAYQAAQTGLVYGAAAGVAKHCTPFVPKRGYGIISCALIGAIAGAGINVLLQQNAAYCVAKKNKILRFLSDEEASVPAMAQEATPTATSNTDTVSAQDRATLLKCALAAIYLLA